MSEDNLPEGWAATELDDLLEPGGLFDGPFGSSLKTADYTDAGVRVIRLENLANLRFVEEKRSFIPYAKYESLRKHTVVPGDIVFGSFVDGLPRVCIVPRLDMPAIAKADCFCVRTRADVVDRSFLMYQLGRSAIRDVLTEEIHGATRPRITTKQLRDVKIVVPPLAEQRRIVGKVESLLVRVNTARAHLAGVPAILMRFRQAVLAAACSGRLTADWRQARKDLEPASRVIEQLKNRFRGDIWHDVSFEFRPQDDLPGNWVYEALGNLGTWNSGGTPSKSVSAFWKGGAIPWVTPKDMKCEIIADSLDRITEAGAVASRLRLLPIGTLIFVVRGLILARRFPVALTNAPVTVNQDLRCLSPRPPLFNGYLLRALQAEGLHVLRAVREATHGTLRLESPALKRWPIPLPPIAEQEEIARRVDALLAFAEHAGERRASAMNRVEKLSQAVLAKAFRGELVPTEAEVARREGRDYEPGSEVLMRCRLERNELAPGPRRRRGKPSKGRNAMRTGPTPGFHSALNK